MVKNSKELKQTQPTEEERILQRLRSLGLSIPSEDLYTLIKESREAYLIGKYELLKEIYNQLIWRLDSPKAEVSGASVIYKKGLEIDPKSITIPIAFFSITMSLLSKFLNLGDLITALTISLAVASTGYSIVHWKWLSGERKEEPK